MGAGSPSMDHPFRDPFVIERRDLLAEDEVLQQRGTPGTGSERVLIVGDVHALVGRQQLAIGSLALGLEIAVFGILTVVRPSCCRGLRFLVAPTLIHALELPWCLR